MDKQSFESKFESIITKPLSEKGFRESGKSLFMVDDQNAISLIRLGGKMASPGSVSHVLCFRHSFLPNVDETIPDGFEKEVFSYPLKLKPLKIKGVLGTKIKYAPTNLNYDCEKFEFGSKSEIEVENYLKSVVKAIETLLSWAKNHQPTYLANQIEKNGEAAWIEKLWLTAYAKKVS